LEAFTSGACSSTMDMAADQARPFQGLLVSLRGAVALQSHPVASFCSLLLPPLLTLRFYLVSLSLLSLSFFPSTRSQLFPSTKSPHQGISSRVWLQYFFVGVVPAFGCSMSFVPRVLLERDVVVLSGHGLSIRTTSRMRPNASHVWPCVPFPALTNPAHLCFDYCNPHQSKCPYCLVSLPSN
jgi:hypothetical protein